MYVSNRKGSIIGYYWVAFAKIESNKLQNFKNTLKNTLLTSFINHIRDDANNETCLIPLLDEPFNCSDIHLDNVGTSFSLGVLTYLRIAFNFLD